MFRPIAHETRFAAMDAVEAVSAGRPHADRAMGAAIATLLERGATQGEAVAATAIAMQEEWPARYGGSNTALMMAGAFAAARTGHDAMLGPDRVDADEHQAAGRFHMLAPEHQEDIASGINRGTLLSARERQEVSERYDAALARVGGEERNDGHEQTRRAIETAVTELGIGPNEWHGVGERGAVSFLLHVQAPAMLSHVGAQHRGDPANHQYIQLEAGRIAEQGMGAPDTVHGIRHNLELMRQMSQWLAPTLSATGLAASAPDGPIARLAEQIDREVMGHSMGARAAAHAMAAGQSR